MALVISNLVLEGTAGLIRRDIMYNGNLPLTLSILLMNTKLDHCDQHATALQNAKVSFSLLYLTIKSVLVQMQHLCSTVHALKEREGL